GAALSNLTASAVRTLVIAYEPVWAVGTGSTATPEIANEAHGMIRDEVRDLFGNNLADSVRILYGGSVKPENSVKMLSQPEIDGLLIGGASLDPTSFAAIIKNLPE
ncbi:MAG: triose-phosphate isomerase, partial [Janthinobacterium lividum]